MMRKHNNEDAVAAGIITIVFVFLLAGILFIANGYAIDMLTKIINTTVFSAAAASQARYDTVNMMAMVVRFEPIVVLLGLGLNHIVNSTREFSDTAPLSTLAMGAAELIFSSVFLIGVALFGGYGLDKVVSTMTTLNFGASGMGLYDIVQYLPGLVYGFLFLALVGANVLFILQCVGIVDYANGFTQSNDVNTFGGGR